MEHILNEVLKQQPDLIMLDIDHCSINTLQPDIDQYLTNNHEIIGLSKNTGQAYRCIKLGITDYLLKPLSELEIRKSLINFIQKNDDRQENICFKNYSDYYFLNPNEILYLKADNNTTDIYLISGKVIPAFKSLKVFEENLPNNFLRIHNSYIINTSKILRINFGKSQVYLDPLEVGKGVPFSKSYRDKLKSLKKFLAEQDIVF
uniref:LytR/AlgR family response regulator transcription factor n=1 Tax=uncultured Christiangramia sp. TaxID=503836 RepID=UPI002621A3E3|nr:LytTR family transcriptional regulator DNA-binding domain-containing protein [uncultured Christiangramia sp.]